MLPADYAKVLANGVHALQHAEVELRARAEGEFNVPKLWLAVRDISSLVGRLREADDWAWQTGFAGIELSPLDLRLLSTLLEAGRGLSPYRDEPSDTASVTRTAALRSLRDFLERYMAREFQLEDAETYRPPDHSRAS